MNEEELKTSEGPMQSPESEVMMQSAEIDVIKAFLRRDETVMFEFGSGGSTTHFAPLVKELYSAEHAPAWSELVAKKCEAAGIKNATLLSAAPNREAWAELGCAGVGIYDLQIQFGEDMRETFGPNFDDKWLHAPTEKRQAVFRDYMALIGKAGPKRFDVVLIDGRARGECAIAALPYVDDKSVVIIHDWNLEEEGYRFGEGGELLKEAGPVKLPPRCSLPPYKRVLEFYDIVCEVGKDTHFNRCKRCGLVVLRPKKQQPEEEVAWWGDRPQRR